METQKELENIEVIGNYEIHPHDGDYFAVVLRGILVYSYLPHDDAVCLANILDSDDSSLDLAGLEHGSR